MRADVVVVGAGALGLSTALQVALLGRSVVVVERDTPGSQASGRAAGLFKSIQADELRTRLARRSIDRARTFQEWAGAPLTVTQSGSLAIARTSQHARFLHEEVARSRSWGVCVDDLDPAGLAQRSSLYQPTGDEDAWWCPEDVYIEEPMALVDALVEACRSHGVVLVTGAEVTGIEVGANGRVRAVHGSFGSAGSGAVVDAAGAWARPVAALAGAVMPLAAVRHQLMITRPTSEVDPTDPIVRVVDSAVYLRPARGGVMLGGFEAAPLGVDPGRLASGLRTADLELDLGVLQRLAATVEREVPAVDAVSLADRAEHRGGMFTMTPDGRFLVGPVPGVDGLFVASGCNGSGFSSSLAIGEALAAVLCGSTPFVDLTALAPGRVPAMTDDGLLAAGVWQYAHYYDPVATYSV